MNILGYIQGTISIYDTEKEIDTSSLKTIFCIFNIHLLYI